MFLISEPGVPACVVPYTVVFKVNEQPQNTFILKSRLCCTNLNKHSAYQVAYVSFTQDSSVVQVSATAFCCGDELFTYI